MDVGGAHAEPSVQAAWEAYGVAPAEFVATRTRWVRALRSQGLREEAAGVAALRKPSVSAAAINALVRAGDAAAAGLRELGIRMRHAQSALDAAGLAGLRGERDEVLDAWVAAAREHAPVPLTTTAVAEVRDTAVAALADASAAEATLSGTLTRALTYSGFGEVDVSDAVARTSTGVVLTRIEGGGGSDAPDPGAAAPGAPDPDALAVLRASVSAAEEEVSTATAARRTALEAQESAGARVRVAEQGLEQARRLLEQAQTHAAEARDQHEQAGAALAGADAALTAARARRERARRAWEQAQDGG